MSTNRSSVLATTLFVLFVALLSCSNPSNNNTGKDEYFYPKPDIDYYHVTYLNDTIVITGESSTFHFTKKWLLTKENGEYYLEKGSYKKLFMSNSISYSDSTYVDYPQEPQKLSIQIEEQANGDLISSTLWVNVTETHRNPLLHITYDKDYKITNIKEGTVFLSYQKDESNPSNKNAGKDECFYPKPDYDYYHVKYLDDTIIVSGKGSLAHEKWLLTKQDGDYYLETGGYKKLFMSNSIYPSNNTYQEWQTGMYSYIQIKTVKDDLKMSSYVVSGFPCLFITYDKDYKITNIKQGTYFINYQKEKSRRL